MKARARTFIRLAAAMPFVVAIIGVGCGSPERDFVNDPTSATGGGQGGATSSGTSSTGGGQTTSGTGGTAGHIVVHVNGMTVDPFSKAPVTASCDGQHGEQMIGGGYKVSPGSAQFHVMASYPSTANTWTAVARNTMPTPGTVIAYVYCFVGPPTLTISLASSPATTIAAGPAGGAATASCGANVATSGGFYFSPPGAAAPDNLDPDG